MERPTTEEDFVATEAREVATLALDAERTRVFCWTDSSGCNGGNMEREKAQHLDASRTRVLEGCTGQSTSTRTRGKRARWGLRSRRLGCGKGVQTGEVCCHRVRAAGKIDPEGLNTTERSNAPRISLPRPSYAPGAGSSG